MIVKVFESNSNGKIEFTRCELEKLLNEVYTKGYNVGYSEGSHKSWTWTSPSLNYRDINTISTSDHTTPISNLTCSSADGAIASTTTVSNGAPKITYGGGSDVANAANASNASDAAYTIEAKSVAPSSITLQIKDFGDVPTNINFAKSLDEIVNTIFNNSSKNEVETPHSRLAKELRSL